VKLPVVAGDGAEPPSAAQRADQAYEATGRSSTPHWTPTAAELFTQPESQAACPVASSETTIRYPAISTPFPG